MLKQKIELGDEVRHLYSGFQGVAISQTHYISGCDRFAILPRVGKDKKIIDPCSFDEPELVIIKKGKQLPKPRGKRTGGFQPEVRHLLK